MSSSKRRCLRSGAYISAESDDEFFSAPDPKIDESVLLTSSAACDVIPPEVDEIPLEVDEYLETAGVETINENKVNEDQKDELIQLQQQEIDILKREGEKNKKLIELLKDQVECPVCLEVPRELPVAICPNGHVVCKSCKRNSCPKCRAVMGSGKSLLAGTMIKNLLHMCKFAGCDAMVAHDHLIGHFKICQYREVVCPCSGEVVALNSLKSHLLNSPCVSIKAISFPNDSNTQWSYSWRILFDNYYTMNHTSEMTKVCYFVDTDASFVLQPYRMNENFHVRLVMFGSESDCMKYRVKITLHSSESTPSNADVFFTSVVVPDSVDQYKHEERFKHSKLTVSDKEIERILTFENNKHQLSMSLLVIKQV